MSKYDMDALENDIGYLRKGTDEIKLCLYGDRKDPESEGLVDIVRKNTGFRKRVTKFFVITWGAIIVPVSHYLYIKFKGN